MAINGHTEVLDGSSKLLSWLTPQNTAYVQLIGYAWNYFKTVPTVGGTKPYLRYCCFDSGGTEFGSHNPAMTYACFVDSLIPWLAFSGDSSLISHVKACLDYMLANGTTSGSWDWPNVPFATSEFGAFTYTGDGDADDDDTDGLEPDKIGELGHAYLKFWQLTGDTTYRDAAIDCADALQSHVRTGSTTQSPWPFRVYGPTGAVNQEYGCNAVAGVELFDELIRLGIGNTSAYTTARNTAWNWVLGANGPMTTNKWQAYFEDIHRSQDEAGNDNQLVPMETCRYILNRNNPADVDPNYTTHVPALLTWVVTNFSAGTSFSAQRIDEQDVCCGDPGLTSHTARWASINALWYAQTSTSSFKEDAYRSFNFVTYGLDNTGGRIKAALAATDDYWWSDSYGDLIKHYMDGFAAVPEWAPPSETHIVSVRGLGGLPAVVQAIKYNTLGVSYTTFEPGIERVRVAFTPTRVTSNGVRLPQRSDLTQEGWVYDAGTTLLSVRHDTGTAMVLGDGDSTAVAGHVGPRAQCVGVTTGGQAVRPVADVTDGGWTNELDSNVNLYASIDELPASDADYIKSSASPVNDAATVALGVLSAPVAGTRTLYYRYKKDLAGHQIDLVVDLMEGASVVQTWTHTDVPYTWQDAVQTVSGTITNWSALRLRFTANQVS
jgi:hypothetical protein